MNSGKSLLLIKSFFDFAKTSGDEYNADNIICFTSSVDNRFGFGKITSRPLDTQLDAFTFHFDDNLIEIYKNVKKSRQRDIELILVDEAQFLNREQVLELCSLVDNYKINIMCYGLRTNFKGELFEGSNALLCYADKLREVKNKCSIDGCTNKATMNARIDKNGRVVREGNEVEIGLENRYQSYCRSHFLENK
jgi:thymidine kinase